MIPADYFFTGKFAYSFQMLVAGGIYGMILTRRKQFALRILTGIPAYLVVSCLLPDLEIRRGVSLHPVSLYALCVLLIVYLFADNLKKYTFLILSTIATQHMAVSASDSVSFIVTEEFGGSWQKYIYWGVFLAVLTVCYALFGRQNKEASIKIPTVKLLFTAGIIIAVVYILRTFSMMHIASSGEGKILLIAINLYSVINSFSALCLLFSFNNESVIMAEKQVIEHLLHERNTQEKFSKEVIKLLNIKCHDIKHQINYLRKHESDAKEGLLKIENIVKAYDEIAQTGNEVLDTILTEKSIYCHNNGIRFDYMADGKSLDYLQTDEICALFGNILENAIEAEMSTDKEKRMISLQIFKKLNYLCIHAENYYKGEDRKEWKTDKADKRYHGFGLKSIQYIVQKHHGNMTIAVQNNRFCLDILLPSEGK